MWRTEQKACRTLLCITSFVGERDKGPPQQKPKGDIWQDPIFKGIAYARGLVSSNNGVRPQNILPLLAVVGFDVRTLDDDLLSELDALATIRGSHAHNASAVHLGQTFDPFDRQKKIERLLELMICHDELFSSFMSSQFVPIEPRPQAKKNWQGWLANLLRPGKNRGGSE